MRRTFPELVHAHVGRPAVVMGGGPSLVTAFESGELPDDAVLISANDHGCRLAETGLCRMPDYIAAADNIRDRLAIWDVPVLSTREWADIQVFRKPVHNSGMFGAWAAWVMGCFPIIPVGMDLWQGGTYYDDPDAESNGHEIPYEVHLERWRHTADVIHGSRIRVLEGAVLAAVFPVYRPDEPAPKPTRRDSLLAQTAGQRVRMLIAQSYAGMELAAGDEIELPHLAAAKWIRKRIAVKA